jgi:hypothetical protein
MGRVTEGDMVGFQKVSLHSRLGERTHRELILSLLLLPVLVTLTIDVKTCRILEIIH